MAGTICDSVAWFFNAAFALPADLISLGFPPLYIKFLALYQYYSVIPNIASTYAMFAWVGQGFAAGDNRLNYHMTDSNVAFSISVAQDSAVAVTTNFAGWFLLKDFNAATIVDGDVALYDYARNSFLPTVVDISISLNSSSGWQIRGGK